MHHPTVVEHWLQRYIAQWVDHEGLIRRPTTRSLDAGGLHHESTLHLCQIVLALL